MAGSKDDKKPYYEQIADRLIQQLEEGTAPWQKPWEPGVHRMPHNPISGTRYKGINALWLTMQGRSDPRWMTYKQAKSVNAQVQKGEKGTLVQYWKFRDRVPKKDEQGRPVRDENGKKVMVNVELDKPKVFSATVFNAEQIQGLPPLEVKTEQAWDRHDRAEAILSESGANLHHDQADRAYYTPATDAIHLPEKGQFATADQYYATALHELGHWTGHPSRMDRDLSGGFGSQSYAKEELRAEISSMMVGEELEIGHDPGQHAAYVKSWVRVLKEDPKEILRAARDAEKIRSLVMSYEKEQGQTKDVKAEITPDAAERLNRKHKTALPGYSPLESWKTLQAEARDQGYTARIDLNREDDEHTSPYVITYDDHEGSVTPVKTEMYDDGKLATWFQDRRVSVTISNDSADQPAYLRDAFREYEEGQERDAAKASQKQQEGHSGNNSTLPLKIAEKVASSFQSPEDREKFLKQVNDRLERGENAPQSIKIKEEISVTSESDMER